jgi:hypothetical protein
VAGSTLEVNEPSSEHAAGETGQDPLEGLDPHVATLVADIMTRRCPPAGRFQYGTAYAVKVERQFVMKHVWL